MANIHLLDKEISALIAAGEIVERPSSVIKELVENSIDAGATIITVEIKSVGGISYMRVTDNGSGIPKEEISIAFLRHATSKVSTKNDLESIATLGFRGEALTAIAAVSKVEVFSRYQSELEGTCYKIKGGEEVSFEIIGCAKGTTFIVKDIFFNTPVRMKFLKKDIVEANAIASLLDKIALSRPDISFHFIRDGKETLYTQGDGNLKYTIFTIYGKDFINTLLPVQYAYMGTKVEGFIGKATSSRPNRSMQQFFINGRYIKSTTVMIALEQAFKGKIMSGKFPAAILHIDLAFEAIDVNVHPSKLEVRFIQEKLIFDTVYYAIKTAIKQFDTPDTVSFSQKTSIKAMKTSLSKSNCLEKMKISLNAKKIEDLKENVQDLFSTTYSSSIVNKPNVCDDFEFFIPQKTFCIPKIEQSKEKEKFKNFQDNYFAKPTNKSISVIESQKKHIPISKIVEVEENTISVLKSETKDTKSLFIGELFKTYIILQYGINELVLIDKHAAHEKILYNQMKNQARKEKVFSQILLEPCVISLDKIEYALVLDSIDLFSEAGFALEDFGSGSVIIRSAPLFLEKFDISDCVMEMASYLKDHHRDHIALESMDWLYRNIACRAAMKAGDRSSPEELVQLVEYLDRYDDLYYCPHGRPIRISITRKELEKQFGRI